MINDKTLPRVMSLEQIEMMIMKELSRDSLSELLDYYGIQLCELEQFMERAKTDLEEDE